MTLLTGRNITKTINRKTILNNISISIDKGAIVTLLGPSGSGKTVLLRTIMGLESHEKGELYYNDSLLSDGSGIIVPPEKRGFSLMFQEYTLFPHLNVLENIMIGLNGKGDSEQRTLVSEFLELLDIVNLKNEKIDTLSGGEQQRVALARALTIQPSVLLLDEPFSNIDIMMKQRLYEDFKQILKRYNMTTIFATHDHGEAFYFSDQIYVIKDGEIIDVNTPELLYAEPQNSWVASFVGETNFLIGDELHSIFNIPKTDINDTSTYLVRPEGFKIVNDDNVPWNATIEQITFLGFFQEILAKLKNGKTIRVKDLHRQTHHIGERINVQIVSYRSYPKDLGEVNI